MDVCCRKLNTFSLDCRNNVKEKTHAEMGLCWTQALFKEEILSNLFDIKLKGNLSNPSKSCDVI